MKYLLSAFMALVLVVTGFISHTQKVFAENGSDDNGGSESENENESDDSGDDSDEDMNDDKGGLRERFDRSRNQESRQEKEDWKKALLGAKAEFQLNRNEMKGEISIKKDEFKKRHDLLKDQFEKRSEEFKTRKEDLKEELKNKLGEIRGNIFMRFEVATERLGQIQDKMSVRIEAYVADGKDMTEAKKFLDSSKSHVSKAKDFIAQAKVKAQADVSVSTTATITDSSENAETKALREEVRGLLKNAKDELKLAHQDLKDSFKSIIKVLKPESNDDNNDSSETSTVTQ